jgi:hypothetical protein
MPCKPIALEDQRPFRIGPTGDELFGNDTIDRPPHELVADALAKRCSRLPARDWTGLALSPFH